MRGASSELLPAREATAYRSVTMRLAYLAQDRGDLAEAAKYLAQRMKTPRLHDWEQVKRIARYVTTQPAARLRFRQQKWPGKATAYTDSDWGSCPISRKSTSGLVLMHGRHCLRTSSTLQSLTTLSVAESEFYALIKGASAVLGLQLLFADWGLQVTVEVQSDSTSCQVYG